MKTILVTFISLTFYVFGYSQEIEFGASVNTSSEERLQNSKGISLSYQHDMGKRGKVGFRAHYAFRKTKFDDVSQSDYDPNYPIIEKNDSRSNWVSFRMNVHALLVNKENYSIAFGPEIGYHRMWGKDGINRYSAQTLTWKQYTETNQGVNAVGFGLLTKAEIKNFLNPNLSLCFSIIPQIITNGLTPKMGGSQVFSGGIGFTEFQVSLKYRLAKK